MNEIGRVTNILDCMEDETEARVLGNYMKTLNKNNKRLESRWNALKQKAIDYRFNKTGSHEDGRYCVAISVTDLLKWMEELEGNDEK